VNQIYGLPISPGGTAKTEKTKRGLVQTGKDRSEGGDQIRKTMGKRKKARFFPEKKKRKSGKSIKGTGAKKKPNEMKDSQKGADNRTSGELCKTEKESHDPRGSKGMEERPVQRPGGGPGRRRREGVLWGAHPNTPELIEIV